MMNRPRIYISGPITGKLDYINAFKKAENEIKKIDSEFIPINPAMLGAIYGDYLDYDDYIEIDLEILKHCDGIYMLEGWQDSRGAKIEYGIAKAKNMMIYFQDESAENKAVSSFDHIYKAFDHMTQKGEYAI